MDIAIAGGGIAGLSLAAMLARLGLRPVVYDKAPALAAVGSGLIVQPVAQRVLSELGWLEVLRESAAPLKKLYAENKRGQVVLNVDYAALGEDIHGLGVHRAALFDILLRAATEAGAAFERDRHIIDAQTASDGRLRLVFQNGAISPPFDLVVDAMGVRSPLVSRNDAFLTFGALWANIPWPDGQGFPETELTQRYSSANRSAGVMPIGRFNGEKYAAFFWTLRQDAYSAWRTRGMTPWKDEVARFWPEAGACLDHLSDVDQLIFARYAHHSYGAPVEGRLVHIGDAWHAASPQLGQGANMALLDAFALARALSEKPTLDTALRLFLNRRARHVQLYQAISGAFTPIYQSESKILPALRDRVVGPVSNVPFASRFLAAMVAGRLGYQSMH